MRPLPHIAGALTMVAGVSVLAFLLVHLNARQHRAKETNKVLDALLAFEPAKPPRRRPQPAPKRRAPPKTTPRASAPRPNLGADLSGLGAGVALFDSGALQGLSDGMVDAQKLAKDMVMTEDAVDVLPDCSRNPMPRPPPRAAQKGISGEVELRMLVDGEGAVQNAKVTKSDPPGFFDEAVLDTVRGWRCKPATYQGQGVKLWITLPIRFKLG